MSTPLVIRHNAVTAQLVDPSREDKLLVQQLLSFAVDGFDHMEGVGSWDGRSSFFRFADSTFPAGFVVRLYRAFKKMGRTVNVVRRPFPEPLGPAVPVVDSFPEDPRYDYQRQVYDLLLRHGQMIAQVATGGGKSRIAKLAHARIGRPTLFLTTRAILMHQMRDAFIRDMKVPVGIYGDDEWSAAPALMNCGMVQTFAARLEDKTVAGELEALNSRRVNAATKEVEKLTKRLKKEDVAPDSIARQVESLVKGIESKYPPIEHTRLELAAKVEAHQRRRAETIALLERFEFVILEEAHEASGNSYFEVLKRCRNAHYRLALTGTPFMKDSELDNMRLEACSGTVAIRISEYMLIERGILAKPYFKYVDIKNPAPMGWAFNEKTKQDELVRLYKSSPWQRAYEVGIAGAVERNTVIVNEVRRASAYGLTSMVLVQHISHGKRLAQLLLDAGVRVAFICGPNEQNDRQAAIQALAEGRIDCLIGSTILDVGVDVPAVGLIVLAGGGKAEVALRQRIGRGARAKKVGPNVFFVLDFTDHLNNHLRDHARERRKIVDTTPGFAEGIVSDFQYERLGFTRLAA